ncbi:hypothetical protein LOAG_13830 [Loa loa]|uniref:Uncharacterized protein n=1 Tax=Loa loa TaxID=7209 RepID=A0A1S0TJ84_LOALO|nr:hypothetical protein LOAG_13830 [Loa loa]EFO14686.2 hypothetical protein LOAG_13830 [Loa loa]
MRKNLQFTQDSMPHRQQWTEEKKTEVWSSSSKGAWQYDTKHFSPVTVTPPTTRITHELWDSGKLQHRDITSYDERLAAAMDTGSTVPSSTILVKQNQEGRLISSETWDRKPQKISYSTASTLEKTRELDEEIAQKEDTRRHSPIWAIVKSTRHDESEGKEPKEKAIISNSDDSIHTTRTSKWEITERSSKERSDMTAQQKTPQISVFSSSPKVSLIF